MRNTFRVSFFAKKPHKENQKKYMIYARITICGQQCQFSTTYSVTPKLWDTKGNRVKGNSMEAVEINSLLDHLRARIILCYNTRANAFKAISPHLIKIDLLSVINEHSMLLSFFRGFNEIRIKQIGYGIKQSTHNKYELTIRRLEEFILMTYNASDIQIQRVTLRFILNFECFLKTKYGLSDNSTERLIKIFKRIVLLAKEEGIIQHNPFQNHKSKSNTPVRTFLNDEELKLLINAKFNSLRLEKVKDMFLFCCFTGLSYADLSKLKKKDIRIGCDGEKWIIIKRLKTSKESRIKLLDLPIKIILKYQNFDTGEYLLPVISNANFNLYLKEIALICGINKLITVHTARHTFATTISISKGLPIETLSKMLGHTTIRTTQLYARILDDKISKDIELLGKNLARLQSYYDATMPVRNANK